MNIPIGQTRFRGIVQSFPAISTHIRATNVAFPRFIVVLQISAIVVASGGLALLLIKFSSLLSELGPWGYVGVAAAEFGNSAMLAVPTPASVYTFAMGATLNPFIVGIVGGVFSTLGELIGYYLGRRGGVAMANSPTAQRLSAWTARWGSTTLFVCAVLPVPFDIAGVWAGAARYPLSRFVPIVLLGKLIKITSIALAGYFGLEALAGIFELGGGFRFTWIEALV